MLQNPIHKENFKILPASLQFLLLRTVLCGEAVFSIAASRCTAVAGGTMNLSSNLKPTLLGYSYTRG